MRGTHLLKWGLKGVAGLAANLALLTVWVEVVGLPAWLAIAPNFVLLSTAGYLVASRWIWPDGVSPSSWRGHAVQYLGQQTAMVAGKAGNYLLYLVLLPVVRYQLAWFVGAVTTFLLTFVLNQWWWNRHETAV